MLKWLLCICAALAFGGCSVAQDQSTLEMTAEESYDDWIYRMEAHYAANDFDKIEAGLAEFQKMRVIEIPTYERVVFEAALLERKQQYAAARVLLDDFELMTRIDAGDLKCADTENTIVGSEETIVNQRVFVEMCWEAAFEYYGVPNETVEQRRTRLGSIANDVRGKLERKP